MCLSGVGEVEGDSAAGCRRVRLEGRILDLLVHGHLVVVPVVNLFNIERAAALCRAVPGTDDFVRHKHAVFVHVNRSRGVRGRVVAEAHRVEVQVRTVRECDRTAVHGATSLELGLVDPDVGAVAVHVKGGAGVSCKSVKVAFAHLHVGRVGVVARECSDSGAVVGAAEAPENGLGDVEVRRAHCADHAARPMHRAANVPSEVALRYDEPAVLHKDEAGGESVVHDEVGVLQHVRVQVGVARQLNVRVRVVPDDNAAHEVVS
mmetsp:Transcript_67454/g.186064  ORF Transcript_67454/g.186064 Transcript_67454/m.186064 type:complete len:262 (+) Transcript_67454:1896-2681(+)